METKVTLHRGKIARQPKILAVRVLEREDLARLRTEGRVTPRVRGFRDTHHRLARLVASGMVNEDILRITGYSYTRLNTLRQDPAFEELVAMYREKVTAALVDEVAEAQATAAELINRSLRQIEEHYDKADDAGELIPLGTLVKVGGDLMDRFGFPKRAVQTNVNYDMAKKMEKMMAASGQRTVIDAPALASGSEERPPGSKEPVVVAGFRRRA